MNHSNIADAAGMIQLCQSGSNTWLQRPEYPQLRPPGSATVERLALDADLKYRVAIAVFYEHEKLDEAIVELCREVSSSGAIAALARPGVLTKAFPDATISDSNIPAVHAVHRFGPGDGWRVLTEYARCYEDWFPAVSVNGLRAHVQGGGLILFTFFVGAADEFGAYRILMRLSCDRVELHDLPRNL
ncbi:MAG: hypothetical protein AAF441_19225 [Pseudomonadota bacterium]